MEKKNRLASWYRFRTGSDPLVRFANESVSTPALGSCTSWTGGAASGVGAAADGSGVSGGCAVGTLGVDGVAVCLLEATGDGDGDASVQEAVARTTRTTRAVRRIS
jgi:hypothetical protein